MASSDGEDEDLKAAIALSLAEVPADGDVRPSAKGKSTNPASVPSSVSTPSHLKSAAGFAGLDRRAMEEERLARLANKRQRPITPPITSSKKAAGLEVNTVALPSGARLTTFSSVVNQEQQQRKSSAANISNQRLKRPREDANAKSEYDGDLGITQRSVLPQGSIRYPNGIVKKTWAFGFSRDEDDVKIEEVLEPLTLRTAVLSAFQWDTEWVASKLKTPATGGETRCVFVMQAKEERLRQTMLKETEEYKGFLQMCFPPMDGQIHCMHSKLMLLFHSNKLRIAIPTANLLNFDWGETGVMENSVFMIDLPRREDGSKGDVADLTSFGKELLFFVEKQGLDERVRDGVLNFDFKATENIRFVHTVGGASYGEDAGRTGLPGLARAVRELSLQADDDLEIDFAASSIGSLNNDFLKSVHDAARGEDIIARAQEATSKAKASFFKPTAKEPAIKQTPIRDKLRIYFPLHETVTSSKAGAAGTICLSRRWFDAVTFPRACFRDYRSRRTGLLSHNKQLYARGRQTDATGSRIKNVAWVYVGSANMSKSAWGEAVYDKKRKVWKVNCRNWECGVLLPVSDDRINGHLKTDVDVKRESAEGEDSETQSEEESSRPVNKKQKVDKGEDFIKKEKVEGNDSETESEDERHRSSKRKTPAKLVGMEVFDEIAKPPFEVPATTYNGREPWYFQEYNQSRSTSASGGVVESP